MNSKIFLSFTCSAEVQSHRLLDQIFLGRSLGHIPAHMHNAQCTLGVFTFSGKGSHPTATSLDRTVCKKFVKNKVSRAADLAASSETRPVLMIINLSLGSLPKRLSRGKKVNQRRTQKALVQEK